MIPSETVTLVRLIAELWPSMRINPHTPDAWHPLLEDIPRDAAMAAVYRLAKVSSAYIAPADIRREVAAAAGLLPPAEDDAWEQVLAVALADGVGRSRLHPVLEAAYTSMGRAPAIKTGAPGPTRGLFGQAYRRLSEEYSREVLAGDLFQPPARPVAAIAADVVEPESVDAILGHDTWSLPAPPEGIEPGTRAYVTWAREVAASRREDRRTEATARVQERANA